MFFNKRSHRIVLGGEKGPWKKEILGMPPMQFITNIIILALVGSGFWYVVFVRQPAIPSPTDSRKTEAELVKEVGNVIILPGDEVPRIATVVDPAQYKDDPLLSQSKVGDKVLVYVNLKKAILYRPSEHKIVDVMPFALPPAVTK